MQTKSLTTDLIDDPRLWRLALSLSPDVLSVMVYRTTNDNSIVSANLPLSPDQSGEISLQSLENTVYANPLLLSDFDRIYILVDSSCFLFVPAEIDDTSLQAEMLIRSFPDLNVETLSCDIPRLDATLVFGLKPEIHHFLTRTFFDSRIRHYCYPLAAWLGQQSRGGNTRKMYAHLRKDKVDLFAFDRDSLLSANTHDFHDPMDVVYYILALRDQFDFDRLNEPTLIAGDAEVRDAITPILRRYIKMVLPVIFPTEMMRAFNLSTENRAAIPFPLILTPLCE